MVTVKRYGTGTCLLQNIETEGVEVEFHDGTNFAGFVSWAEFRRLLKARSEAAKERLTQTPDTGGQAADK